MKKFISMIIVSINVYAQLPWDNTECSMTPINKIVVTEYGEYKEKMGEYWHEDFYKNDILVASYTQVSIWDIDNGNNIKVVCYITNELWVNQPSVIEVENCFKKLESNNYTRNKSLTRVK